MILYQDDVKKKLIAAGWAAYTQPLPLQEAYLKNKQLIQGWDRDDIVEIIVIQLSEVLLYSRYTPSTGHQALIVRADFQLDRAYVYDGQVSTLLRALKDDYPRVDKKRLMELLP